MDEKQAEQKAIEECKHLGLEDYFCIECGRQVTYDTDYFRCPHCQGVGVIVQCVDCGKEIDEII